MPETQEFLLSTKLQETSRLINATLS